jgi:2-hydroxychromene-2-carboxylate isomerase
MPAEIEFFFDFISPYTYLASTALPRLAAAHGAAIGYRPFNLVELMKIVGNRPTSLESPNKGAYVTTDLGRWVKRYRVDFAGSPHWGKIDFAGLGRGALVAIEEGRGAGYVDAVFRAVWGEGVDLSERSELIGALARAGFDGARLLERAASPDCVARFERATEAAAARGVFGSPTMFVGTEMFFGNDRLDFMAEALQAAA